MQQIQPQQDKPLQQGELRTVVWQNGKSRTESSPETLQEVLHDPDALIWLDILVSQRLCFDCMWNPEVSWIVW